MQLSHLSPFQALSVVSVNLKLRRDGYNPPAPAPVRPPVAHHLCQGYKEGAVHSCTPREGERETGKAVKDPTARAKHRRSPVCPRIGSALSSLPLLAKPSRRHGPCTDTVMDFKGQQLGPWSTTAPKIGDHGDAFSGHGCCTLQRFSSHSSLVSF